MKKVFEADYGNKLAEDIEKWVREQTITKEGGCKVYRPRNRARTKGDC